MPSKERLTLLGVVPSENYRWYVHWLLLIAFYVLGVMPQIWFQPTVAGQPDPWGWWPSGCATCALLVSMLTDYSERALWEKGLVVIGGVVVYFALTWPVMEWITYHTTQISIYPPTVARRFWAVSRANAALPHFAIALRCTRLMARREKKKGVAGARAG
jgi:hypothetical protein